jgi:hypothetical protein
VTYGALRLNLRGARTVAPRGTAFVNFSSWVPAAAIGRRDHRSVNPSPVRLDGQTWSPTARTALSIIATAGLAVLAVGCGRSPNSHVAQLGTTATQSYSSSSTTPASSQRNRALAFSRCMRSNGIPDFPDPSSSGVLPKSQLEQIAAGNPRYPAAQTACGDLLPNGALPPESRPTQVELREMERDALTFARCVRSHGVPSWPDYTVRDEQPIFDLHGTSIDPNSPEIVAKEVRCKSLLQLSHSPPTSGGAG